MTKAVVETSLGDAVAESLRGKQLGQSIVAAVDDFVYRDIESPEDALRIFSFVQDSVKRDHLAQTLRGARWTQKTGLVFARAASHPAHAAQVRSQMIEYGAISEYALRICLEQGGGKQAPDTFDEIIEKSRAAGILTSDGRKAADALRLLRNRTHLWIDAGEKELRAEREGRRAYMWMTVVVNECRRKCGLDEWHFGSTKQGHD